VNEDIEVAVTLAGLLHDIGHGPFSHAFDHDIAKVIGLPDYMHEEQSCRILDFIVDEYSIDIGEY
jgi:HD superfamily phosphohydrolase